MKTYEVRHNIGDMVYILLSKKAFQTQIQKIRVTEQPKQNWINGTENQKKNGKTGITIEYLVQVDYKSENVVLNGAGVYNFDWVDQNDMFETKEELIAQIK